MSLKKTSRNILNLSIKISIYALMLTLLIVLSTKGYGFGKAVFSEKGYEKAPGIDVSITVDSGESVMSVAQELVDLGVVKSKIVFFVQTKLYQGKFIPGTYTVNSSASPEDIIEILSTDVSEQETEGK